MKVLQEIAQVCRLVLTPRIVKKKKKKKVVAQIKMVRGGKNMTVFL